MSENDLGQLTEAYPTRYRAPFFMPNGHLQSIIPSLFRRPPMPAYQRERIDTPDGDFLDLDWSRVGSQRLVILSHGLEGSSQSKYILGMSHALNRAGWDTLAWNYRSCSGEMNRLPRFYHSGAIGDLDWVLQHAIASGNYPQIALVGFSLGGNLTLVYLGTHGAQVNERIVASAVFSVPCDLAASSRSLARSANSIYMKRFIRDLGVKIRQKKAQFPDVFDDTPLVGMRTFKQFDDAYTAPLHGFRDAEHYWAECSSRFFIEGIARPTLLINARNDPFLAPECFPEKECEANPHMHLIMPRAGGHVGFARFAKDQLYWSELQAIAFLNRALG